MWDKDPSTASHPSLREASGASWICSGPWYLSRASWLYLQLSPLDPAHTAGSIAPGLLGPKHQLALPELVGACGCHLSLHFLKPLLMSLGATPGEKGGEGERSLVSGR